MMRKVSALMLGFALVACGQKTELKPAEGKALPVAAYGADQQANADDLLKVPTQAQPERSVELRKRSEKRTDDPFDLPPTE